MYKFRHRHSVLCFVCDDFNDIQHCCIQWNWIYLIFRFNFNLWAERFINYFIQFKIMLPITLLTGFIYICYRLNCHCLHKFRLTFARTTKTSNLLFDTLVYGVRYWIVYSALNILGSMGSACCVLDSISPIKRS